MTDDLEAAFHRRMLELCDTMDRECTGFSADRLRERIARDGGHTTAVQLAEADNAPGGFVRLWELGRLDLAVETEILRPEWEPLFDDAQRARVAERLERYGWSAHAAS